MAPAHTAAALIRVRHFTDPACPFAFSAEPQRFRLLWTFGDQLEWETRMVVLSDSPEEYVERGFTPEKQSGALRALQQAHGMPIDTAERPRMSATEPACRAVVAARLHRREAELPLLRALRVRTMAAELLDESATLSGAAADVGLDGDDLAGWMEDPEVERALAEDKRVARRPLDAALALDHKLADAEDGRRYTCPSYELERAGEDSVAVPGFQPFESYDVALANLEPQLDRRPPPDSVEEVLRWAAEPLATAEVAALRGIPLTDAREELARVAVERPVGTDGYWTLP